MLSIFKPPHDSRVLEDYSQGKGLRVPRGT